ncbi:RNA exonuclease 4 protein [Rutstroemia sp. NJR-2017a WRK4]|nr:RNA exonuclease 4 protein [Rutstroemia sp. NJR-2017a WRK4]
MAPELSSNWKTLQAALKKNPEPTLSQKKRSAPEPSSRTKDSIAKRRRLEGGTVATPRAIAKPSLKGKKKMGIMASTPISSATEPETEPSKVEENDAPSASLALWAEDNNISVSDLAAAYGSDLKRTTTPGSPHTDTINGGLNESVEIGKYISIDCEMVGVGGDEDRSVLARVSIVNFHGHQIYDSFVRPLEFVTDWRTHVSGISPKNMSTARPFSDVQETVSSILKGRILVGHAIKHDLAALGLSHPRRDIRDTSKYSGFRKYAAGRTPGLKKLAREVLGVEIQGGEHSSVEDARATMLLFRRVKGELEAECARFYPAAAAAGGGQGNAKGGGKGKKKKKGKK